MAKEFSYRPEVVAGISESDELRREDDIRTYQQSVAAAAETRGLEELYELSPDNDSIADSLKRIGSLSVQLTAESVILGLAIAGKAGHIINRLIPGASKHD